jgi:hypothetical protein
MGHRSELKEMDNFFREKIVLKFNNTFCDFTL